MSSDPADDSGGATVELTTERLANHALSDISGARRSAGFGVAESRGRAYFGNSSREEGVDELGRRKFTTRHDVVVMVDLATGRELTSTRMPRNFWLPGWFREGQGVAVDEPHGRLHVLYETPPTGVQAGGFSRTEQAAAGSPCASGLNQHYCPAGILTLDLDTLEVVGDLPLGKLTVDGVTLAPYPLDITIGPDGRLLMLVQDRGQDHPIPVTPFSGPDASLFYHSHQNPHYLLQLDPAAGRVDWATRVEGCRGSKEDRDSPEFRQTADLPHPGAILWEQRDGADPVVWVACNNTSARTGVAVRVPLGADGRPYALPLAARDPAAAGADASPGAPVAAAPGQDTYAGPDKVAGFLADPVSGRLLMKAFDGGEAVWWVFDVAERGFVGTIGVGRPHEWADEPARETFGFDRTAGRLYSLTPAKGLLVADIRHTPLPQALQFAELAEIAWHPVGGHVSWPLQVVPGAQGRPTRLYVPQPADPPTFLYVVEDRLPPSAPAPPAEDPYAGRTLDLDETAGVTAANVDGTARGFGLRAIMIGGAEGLSRVGPVDAVGVYEGTRTKWAQADGFEKDGLDGDSLDKRTGVSTRPRCHETNRELVLGFVGPDGPAVVDGGGSRGSAVALQIDGQTASHLQAPVSACAPTGWEAMWSKALFGRGPAAEPSVAIDRIGVPAECVGSDAGTSQRIGDATLGTYAAEVRCDESEASGFAYTRGAEIEGLHLLEALSSFRIYRDPGRGIVSRVESVARGVNLDGLVRISTVRGAAESWANGRRQPVPDEQREPGYDPNCDLERSAGTCFQRHLFGVWTPGWSCGPCGDEDEAVARMNRAMGAYGAIRLRQPDADLARGSSNGFIAAVQKPDFERFAELVLNSDLLQTTVPTLEVVRYSPPNRLKTITDGGGPRGRQIYQFAGVEVSSSYGISCLLVYDEATGVCAPPVEEAGSVTVVLHDTEGKPLAGGAFELRRDGDADGVVGLADVLVGEGACVTGEDGTGTCRFEHLTPGSYLVSQVAAPPGYAAVEEPWVSEVAPGEARTVTFTNASNLSTIEVSAVDDAGKPLAGATFAVFADADADGKVAPDTQPLASCTTGADGTCSMTVPTGSYVLMQTAAPAGLAPIEPVAFALTSGGQVAAVGVVNSAASVAAPEAPPAPAPPVVYQPPRAAAPPVERVAPVDPAPEAAPEVGPERDLGGTVTRVIRAPADALRLLTRSPLEAAAWTATLALLCLAAMAITRRRQAQRLTTRPGGS